MAAGIEEAIERELKKAFEKPINQLDGRCLNQVLNGFVNGELVAVVRCKDCKHRPKDCRADYSEQTGFAIEFPDEKCPCQCEDGWYNWYPDDDWFCADGERREAQPDG